jgi:integrase
MPSIEKRGKTFRITVSDGFEEDGVTRIRKVTSYKPPYGMKNAQAWKAARKAAAEFEYNCKNVENFNDSMTLAKLVSWYFDNVAKLKLRKTTLEKNMGQLKRLVLPKLGDKRLRDLRPAVFAEHFRQLRLGGKMDGGGLRATTVNKPRALLSTIFSEAVDADIIPYNPIERVKALKEEKTDPLVLTEEQARKLHGLMLKMPDVVMRGLLLTLLHTGARTGEARALTWNDVDFDKGVISISKSADDKNRVTPPKSKSSNRVIKMSPFLLKYLPQHKHDVQLYAAGQGTFWTENNLVFPNNLGGIITNTVPGMVLKKLVKGTDFPNIHPHTLRHTFASILISRGADVKTVQTILGHSSAAMTLDRYAHAFATATAAAVVSAGDAIAGGGADASRRFLPDLESTTE